jgi:hypothetical protein
MAYCCRGKRRGSAISLVKHGCSLGSSTTTHLSQVVLDNDIVSRFEQPSRVLVQVLPLLFGHPVQVQLPDLGVLAIRALVGPVRLSRVDIVRDLVGRLDDGLSGESGGGLGRGNLLVVRVGEVSRFASGIGIHTHGSEEVVGRVEPERCAIAVSLVRTARNPESTHLDMKGQLTGIWWMLALCNLVY